MQTRILKVVSHPRLWKQDKVVPRTLIDHSFLLEQVKTRKKHKIER